MKTLVITGGIGSGKSAVCAILVSRGIPVYDADARTKALYDSDPALLPALEQALGLTLRGADGHLDRKALGVAIFGDADRLASLEAVVHPAVYRDFVSWRDACPASAPFVVMESAIFLQKPLFRPLADKVLLVDAPAPLRLERAVTRGGLSREEVLSRMDAQRIDAEEADAVLVNDGDLAALESRLDAVLETIWKTDKTKNDMKTDLSKILTVAGHHGLFEYVAQARNGIIAESLATRKRTALDAHSRVNTLADISIFTSEGELKLKEVFLALKEALGDAEAPTSKSSPEVLKALFAQAVPDYDEDRFYVSHMKKVIDWYNELVQYASLDFVEEEEVADEAEADA